MPNITQRLTRHLTQQCALWKEYLFPADCPVCERPLLTPQDAWYGLCADCAPRFSLDGEARCDLCGRPLISEQGRCLPCRAAEGKRALDGAWALYPYMGAFRRLLRSYKFGHSRFLGHFFAEKMIQALAFAPFAGTWMPVPPRPGKIRQAGWDQVAYLARLLKRMREPVCPCLKRLSSQSQKELDRESRLHNLQGRIRCPGKPPEKVILFDDVITTGSTLEACAAALKEAGAGKVYGICLFYD